MILILTMPEENEMPDQEQQVEILQPQIQDLKSEPGTSLLLSDLPTGARGVVRQLRGGREFTGRLAAMGFTIGAELEVIQNSGGGAIIVAVRNTHVALGRGEAVKVQVQILADESQLAALPNSIKVALVGEPNVGKSTVFNLLTGLSQHVGNWPGKTIDLKTGVCRCGDITLSVVDLPGTYSLTANSLEERIARDYILTEQPDVVLDIVDATALERNLYLLCELLALPAPVVLGLNMIDVAEQQGIHVEPHVLEAALGLPVVPMIATKNKGVQELVRAVESIAHQKAAYSPHRPEIREDHKVVLRQIQQLIASHTPAPYPPGWVALKLLEGDEEITRMMQGQLGEAGWAQVHNILKAHEDAILAIAGGRYDWIGRMVRAAVTQPHAGQITLTERLDRIATHPIWGLGLLLAILGVVFWLTFSVGSPLQSFLDVYVVQAGAEWARAALAGAPWWLVGLLTDGIIAGAGMVITFLPILLIFFAVLGALEDVGYMARAAYVMDRFMHWMGLHGKSFLPLCLGFGCNVPGVLCTRIIDSTKARLLTILLTPLIPCTARLAVLAVLAPLFFGSAAVWVSVGVVGLNLLLLVGIGFAFHELVLGGEHVAFIMELPLYHLPNTRTIVLTVWQRVWDFLKKAGSVIVVVSVLVWFLSIFPTGRVETSYLADLGHFLSPLGAWMGLDWRMIVALLTSVVAKENTIATLGILYQAGQQGSSLAAGLAATVKPAAALAFLVVQMSFVPCVATIAAIKQETRSWKWTAVSVGLLLVISMIAGVAVYQAARWV
jgi:ferrous iron transport protein B